MEHTATVLTGAGVGAGLMYLFDPDRGRRRRVLLRDQATKSRRIAREAAETTARDLGNRARGVVSSVRSRWAGSEAGDEVLAQRVRAKLGMLVRHPGAIDVEAEGGRVVLSGPVLADEVDHLLGIVNRVSGVKQVENRLEVHETADEVPALQGARAERPRGPQFEWMQDNWSPTARLVAGLVGGGLAVYGAQQRSLVGAAVAAVGVGLVARAWSNQSLADLATSEATERHADAVIPGGQS